MPVLQLRDLRYAPSADPTDPHVMPYVRNMVPTMRGTYQPAYAMTTSNFAAIANSIGATVLKRADSSIGMYVGTTTALKEGNGVNAWNDKSRGGGYTNTATNWQFAAYGNVIIATNNVDTPQASTGAGVAFADITGAPKAKCIAVLNNVVLLFNYDNGSRVADGWFGSDVGDYTQWTASAANQVANGRLTDTPGPINACATINGTVVVWKSRGMYVGRYVGGDQIWNWQLLNADVGCVAPDAWVHTDAGIVFVSEREVFLYDGANLRPLGGSDIRNYLFTFAAITSASALGKIKLSYDAAQGLVYIFVCINGGDCDFLFVWNHYSNKWGNAGASGSGTFGNPAYSFVKTVFRNPNFADERTAGLTSNSASGAVAVIESGANNVVVFTDATAYTILDYPLLRTATLGEAGSLKYLEWFAPKYLNNVSTSIEALSVSAASKAMSNFDAGGPATFDTVRYWFEGDLTAAYFVFTHTTDSEIAGYDISFRNAGTP